MMKPLATAPLEQESESLTMVFLVPDDVLRMLLFDLFDLILYVHSTIFQLCGTVLPGFNQYLARINVPCSRTTTQ